jgi:hypothetical protein
MIMWRTSNNRKATEADLYCLRAALVSLFPIIQIIAIFVTIIVIIVITELQFDWVFNTQKRKAISVLGVLARCCNRHDMPAPTPTAAWAAEPTTGLRSSKSLLS